MATKVPFTGKSGQLAREAGYRLPLVVLESARGFYLGTANEEGPISRESVEYWTTRSAAEKALAGKEGEDWTQTEMEGDFGFSPALRNASRPKP